MSFLLHALEGAESGTKILHRDLHSPAAIQFHLNPLEIKPTGVSFIQVDIEPVTGLVLSSRFRVQLNIYIEESALPSRYATFRQFNVTCLQGSDSVECVYPVLWVDDQYELGDDEAQEIRIWVRAGEKLLAAPLYAAARHNQSTLK